MRYAGSSSDAQLQLVSCGVSPQFAGFLRDFEMGKPRSRNVGSAKRYRHLRGFRVSSFKSYAHTCARTPARTRKKSPRTKINPGNPANPANGVRRRRHG
jgi:hypothetical protein